MGAWGLDSSENDSTFDAAGFGIMERCGGVELSDTGKEAIAEDILKEDPKALDPTSEYALSTGPVVLLLKMGALRQVVTACCALHNAMPASESFCSARARSA